MNTKSIYLFLTLFIGLTITGYAEDLPKEYRPFKSALGTWHGKNTLTVNTEEDVKITIYKRVTKCWFDQQRRAIRMTDTDTDLKTGTTVVTEAEYRWDKTHQCYKAMAWQDSMVSLLLLRYIDGVFHCRRLDVATETKFESTWKINKAGHMVEDGEMIYALDGKTVKLSWSSNNIRK